MNRKSKYLNNTFGNWICVEVGLANVQTKKSKRPGKRNYYYIMKRITSDNLAEKMIRLNSTEASKVYKKELTVEDILDKREKNKVWDEKRRVSYSFFAQKN